MRNVLRNQVEARIAKPWNCVVLRMLLLTMCVTCIVAAAELDMYKQPHDMELLTHACMSLVKLPYPFSYPADVCSAWTGGIVHSPCRQAALCKDTSALQARVAHCIFRRSLYTLLRKDESAAHIDKQLRELLESLLAEIIINGRDAHHCMHLTHVA